MRKCKLRIAPILFAAALVFLELLGAYCVPTFEVKATGSVVVELLLKLVGACGKDYVEDRISEQLDPSYYHDVVSSSAYPNWEDPESVKKYIDGKGDVHQLASTWNELNEQYELYDGVVDKEYFQAFYEALINNIVDDTNLVLDEIHNNYVNSPFHYSQLSDDEKNAFNQYPFYIVAQSRNADTGTYSNSMELWFCSDLHFGTSRSYKKIDDVYYYYTGLVDVQRYSTVKLDTAIRSFSSYVTNDSVIVNLSSTSDHRYFFSYQNGKLVKIDDEEVSYDAEHETGNGLFSGGFKKLYVDDVFDGYVVKNVGITPLGHSYINNGTAGVELQRTLDKYKDIENPLPIFKLNPDAPGTDVNDYVGNDDDTVEHIDYDIDIKPKFLIGDDEDETVVLQTDDDLNNLDTTPVSAEETVKSKFPWLSFLFDWLQKIIDAILSLVSGIVDGILNGLGDVLKGLFVPSDGFFEEHFSSIQDTLAEKFGFSNYDLLFEALKNCAKGSWDFSGDFTILGKEYHLTMINVDEWFQDVNINKLHYIVRGFIYPFLAIANVHYLVWFLRGSVFHAGSGSSGGGANIASEKNAGSNNRKG